jgi:hypothetical protein
MRKKEEIKSFFSENTETQSNNTLEIKAQRVIFNGEVFTVLKRKNELDKKPPYYLLDLEHKTFLSSLYSTGESNTYLFDVKNKGKYLLRFYSQGYEIEEVK